MTEKRFENRLDKSNVKFNTLNPTWDNEKETGLNVFEMIDELNNLSEKNEVLKSTNMEYEDALGRLEEENEQLKQENQSWLRTASHVDNIAHKDKDYAKRMHNENEQLKKENEDLNEELMGYDSFVLFYKEQVDELKKENEVLKSTEMEYEDALGRLEEENEKLKKDGMSYYLNETLVEDIKTLLVVLAFCEFPKVNRLSTDEFGAIARLQGFLCENIIDLDKLKKEVEK